MSYRLIRQLCKTITTVCITLGTLKNILRKKQMSIKNIIKVVVIVVAIVSFTMGSIKLDNNSKYDSKYDSKGVVVKMLDKNKVECGYYLQRKNNSPVITFYLYDGETIYSSNMNCDAFNKTNKNDIENIIVVLDDNILKAEVNTKEDRANWFDFVRNETKELKELGLIK